MSYLINFACFCFGFSLAVALICQASLRPKAKKILRDAKILRLNRARVPLRVVEDDEDEILFT